MATQLDRLKEVTVVVADSGDFASFIEHQPQDATTNPSLLYSAAQMDEYQELVDDAVEYGVAVEDCEEQLVRTLDKLAVNFGVEILKIVPGRVSTEVDARLSYDTEATVEKVLQFIEMYKEAGVDSGERVLFKIASTWEGIQAAKILEEQGIHVNMTLLFSFCQAVAAADAGATLISPFVGRILDFWKKETGKESYTTATDPGVISVTNIYNYYKKYGYDTIVMGASFRNKEEILALAGCDYLTIGPKFLVELSESTEEFEVPLKADAAQELEIPREIYDEKRFRWALGADPCGTAKLAEGIRRFAEDTVKLENLLRKKIKAKLSVE
eukprot:TRINITY_DN10672_c0_g1_i1.p1 TRINITY_DN10672_c0_g1~~TRINITY_DN10672_c0_g1_i1.p1  ORF type:complete len:342 (+),score=112.72 TRINITY_DN10672_c0_g1_i1:46-1026(+)